MTIDNINAAAFSVDEGINGYALSIALAGIDGVAASDVTMTSFTLGDGNKDEAVSVSARKQYFRRRLVGETVTVGWEAVLIAEDFGYTNGTAMYIDFVGNLTDKVESGQYISLLFNISEIFRAEVVGASAVGSSSTSFSTQSLAVSLAPTSAPTEASFAKASGTDVVAYEQTWFYIIAAAVFFIFILVICFCVIRVKNREKDGNVSDADEGSSIDDFTKYAPDGQGAITVGPEAEFVTDRTEPAEAFTAYSGVAVGAMLSDDCLSQIGSWARIELAKNNNLRREFQMIPRSRDPKSKQFERILNTVIGQKPEDSAYSNEQILTAAFDLYDENILIEYENRELKNLVLDADGEETGRIESRVSSFAPENVIAAASSYSYDEFDNAPLEINLTDVYNIPDHHAIPPQLNPRGRFDSTGTASTLSGNVKQIQKRGAEEVNESAL
jgi:hypothetical protein